MSQDPTLSSLEREIEETRERLAATIDQLHVPGEAEDDHRSRR